MQKYDSVKHYIGWFSAAVAEPLAQSGASYIESNYGVKISPSADEIYLQPSIAMVQRDEISYELYLGKSR